MSLTSGVELAPLKVRMEADIENFKTSMDKAKTIGTQKAKEISKSLATVTKVGETLENVGKKMTALVSVPLMGLSAGAIKMAMDFESSFAKVSTLLDENVVDYDKYKEEILEASNQTKIGVNEFSEAVYESISAGVDQTKAIQFTTEAMKLAKGGFTDGAKAVDVLTTAINAYNLKAEDTTYISDLLITTQNLGKTTVDELAESMGRVIPVAKSTNFDIKELSTSYAVLTKNGIATAEAGTYLKAMLSELSKSGTETDKALRELSGKGFAELKGEGMATTEILKMLDTYAQSNGKTLKDMFGSIEAGSGALVLMNRDGAEYNEILKAMGESAGATQKAFDKIDATPAERFKGALNELKNAGIEMGTSLLPLLEDLVGIIKDLAGKFSSLTEEQRENIIKWGGIAIAAGPVLSVLGKGIQVFTGLKSVVGGVSTALGVFKTSTAVASTATTALGASAGATAGATGGLLAGLGGIITTVAPFALGAAAIGAAAYGVYKVMTEEAVPAVDLFADSMIQTGTVMTSQGEIAQFETVKISEATQKAVSSYLEMDESITQTINDMYINSTTVTEQMCTELTTKYSEMGTTITTGLEEDKQTDVGILQDFFDTSVGIQEEEKTEVLQKINEMYDGKKQKIQDTQDEIKDILEKAKEDNRELTEDEVSTINKLQEQMKEQAIRTLSENEIEANTILERMKGYSTRVTAEQCAENIKKLNENRDNSVKIANDECDQRVKTIIRLRDEAGIIGAEQADKMIKEAQRQRDETIQAVEDTRLGAIDKMRDLNSDLDEQVNTATGEILTTWDKLKRWWSGWIPESKNFYATVSSNGPGAGGGKYNYMSNFNGLDYVPYDGYLAMLHKGERVLTAKENEVFNSTENNSNLTIKIENFVNGRNQDVKAFAEELEFYRKQVSYGGGRV